MFGEPEIIFLAHPLLLKKDKTYSCSEIKIYVSVQINQTAENCYNTACELARLS